MYPFERFTERAKKVLTLAQEEAEAAGHTYIGTEHLLLGLLREQDCVACKALIALGVGLDDARQAVSAALAAGPMSPAQELVPTSRVKRVVELAFEEARRMGQSYVGTEHLLFGLLIEGEGLAAKVLADLGATIERARDEVKVVLTSTPREAMPTARSPLASPPPRLGRGINQLLVRAGRLAALRGSVEIELDDLAMAMSDAAGIAALERLIDKRRAQVLKEQAIAAQDYDAAARHRAEELRAAVALQRAVAEWRTELEAPPFNP